MNCKKLFFTTMLFVLLFFLPFSSKVYANKVFPYKTEIIISNQERTKESFSFKNESTKDIKITPVPYSFDSKNVQIIEDGEIFVRTDREIFNVKPEESILSSLNL